MEAHSVKLCLNVIVGFGKMNVKKRFRSFVFPEQVVFVLKNDSNIEFIDLNHI